MQNFVISTVSNLLILPCNEHQPSIDNTTPKPTSSTHFSLKSLTCDGVYLQESCSFLKRVYSHIKEVAAERCFMKSNVLPKKKKKKKKMLCNIVVLLSKSLKYFCEGFIFNKYEKLLKLIPSFLFFKYFERKCRTSFSKKNSWWLRLHKNPKQLRCMKYARTRVFTDPYSPVQGQNLRFCPYTREYGSVKTCILAYFM